MSKRNKIILIIICALLGVAILATSIYLVYKEEWVDVPDIENESTDSDDTDDTATEKVSTLSVYFGEPKGTYYQGEEFDYTKMRLKYVGKSGLVESNLRCTNAYFEDGVLPDTTTLGYHSYKLRYLDARCEISYVVVEYGQEYAIDLILNVENEVFSPLNTYVTGTDSNYVNELKPLVKTDSKIGPLTALVYIDSILDLYNSGGVVNIYNSTTTTGVAFVNNFAGLYQGKLWVKPYATEEVEIEFELKYYSATRGLRMIIKIDSVVYNVQANSINHSEYCILVSGYDGYDIVINNTTDLIYLTKCTEGVSDIYNTGYSDTMGNAGVKVLTYNKTTNEYTIV